MMIDFLYVVYSPKRNQVKIGRTINPDSRLYQISRHIDDPDCEYIALGKSNEYLADIEKKLHYLFAGYVEITHKRYGEWFNISITFDLLCIFFDLLVFSDVIIDEEFETDIISELGGIEHHKIKLKTVDASWYYIYDTIGIPTKTGEKVYKKALKEIIEKVNSVFGCYKKTLSLP